jgi:precorrin-6A/cobalt-precorrin-6A reductase
VHSDQPERVPAAARVLILGGTAEARDLAARVASDPHVDVITSLAGVTRSPHLPLGEVRIGGFGGTDRLATFLRAERISAVVDATHPFAETITATASAAAASAGVPLIVLRRPGWTQHLAEAHAWRRVPSLEAAAALVPDLGERVFLTTGRRSLAAFAAVDRCWFLSRSVDPPSPPQPERLPQPARSVPQRLTVVLDQGPFPVEAERALLIEHRIDVLVTKNSGGSDAKLVAARELGIPVVMVDRPPLPPGVRAVTTVDAAHAWLTTTV